MKMIFRKERKRSRTIALVLAIMLAMTPFYSFSGVRNGSKAAPIDFTFTVDSGTTVDLSTATGTQNTMTYSSSTVTKSYYVGSGNNAVIEDIITLPDTTFTDTTSTTWTIDEKKVAIIVTDAGVTPDSTAISGAIYTANAGTITISENISASKKISVYMIVTTWNGTDLASKVDSDPFLVATYDITLAGTSPISNTKWVDGSMNDVNSNNYYSVALLSTTTSGYTVKYLIKEVASNVSTAPVVDKTESWTSSVSTIPNTAPDKKLYGYVGLFDSNNELIEYQATSNTLKFDNAGPEVTISLQKLKNEAKDGDSTYCANEANWKTIGTISAGSPSGTFNTRGVDTNIYRIKVTVNDPNSNGGKISGGTLASWSYPHETYYGSYKSIYTQLTNDGASCSMVDNENVYYYTVFNGAPYMCTSKTNVMTLTNVVVTDKLGNSTTKTISYTSDADDPIITSTGSYGISETNASVVTNVTNTSDNNLVIYSEPEIKVNVKDAAGASNSGIAGCTYTIKKDGAVVASSTIESSATEKSANSQDVTFDAATYFSSTGKYKVTLSAMDVAGNESSPVEFEFYVDKTPATVTQKGIYYSTDGGTTYNLLSDRNANSYAYFNVSGDYKYRYYFTVEDELCGYDDSALSKDTNKNNWYYKDIVLTTEGTITSVDGSNQSVTLSDEDRYGNKSASDKSLGSDYVEARSEMTSSDISFDIVDSAGHTKTLAYDSVSGKDILPKYSYLKITVSSGFDITNLTVDTDFTNDMGGSDIFTLSEANHSAATSWSKSLNKKTGRYEVVAIVGIPKAYVSTDDICYKVDVTDAKSQTASKTTASYKYSDTLPQISITSGGNSYDASKWYNTDSFAYEIYSTSVNIYEGGYKINDGARTYISGNGTKRVTGTFTVPEASTVAGTKVEFDAKDVWWNELGVEPFYIKVDKTKPTLSDIQMKGSFIDNSKFAGNAEFKITVGDNLTVDKIMAEVTYPDGTTADMDVLGVPIEGANLSQDVSFDLQSFGNGTPEGSYSINIVAYDKAGNPSDSKSGTFIVDSTAPIVSVKVTDGTTAGKSPMKNFDGTARDYYYRSDVALELKCMDENVSSANIVCTDNGERINPTWSFDATTKTWSSNVSISGEERHTIKLVATDDVGFTSQEQVIEFVVDQSTPAITGLINGAIVYNGGMGFYDLTGNGTITFSLSDTNLDDGDFYYQLSKYAPGSRTETTGDYIKTTERTFSFVEEGEYTARCYSVDKAGNRSDTKEVSIRVDKTAPVLTINGAPKGGTTTSATSVSFVVDEAFWRDANAKVTIYRKAGDGKEETLFKTVNITPTATVTTVNESLTETGIYRFEFEATDKVGHKTNLSQTFTVDREPPVVTLEGVKNYDKTKNPVELRGEITDEFYLGKTVSLTGTRTDVDGKSNKLSFNGVIATANPTRINETFSEDGIYDIHLEVKDIGGNVKTTDLHFTIDSSKPIIKDIESLKLPEGESTLMIRKFSLDEDIDDLVADLTVCEVHMYLNGVEFDGNEDLEDGSYVLLITADDELGNHAEKQYEFVLDTKAPVFIVTGVEDGEVKNESYNIDISLQLEEDTLTSVQLNGENITVKDNHATVEVTSKGDYELTLEAVDDAGNTASETISFTYGKEKAKIWIWLGVGGLSVFVAAGGFFVFFKKRIR